MRNKIMVLLTVLMMIAATVSATIVDVTENGAADAYPTPTQNVVICAEVTDVPDDVTSVTLDWDNGVDPGPNVLSMFDDGTGGDAFAGDGIYCRTLSFGTVNAANDMTVDYDITVDYDDGSDETVSGDYTYDNENPVADADGDYACDEGEAIFLDGASSTDNHPDGIASYFWSAPNGGVFTDATEMNPEFTCYGGNGNYAISLRVTDFGGRTNTDTTMIAVNNVAPTAEANGNYVCSEGQSVTLSSAGSTDPGLDVLSYAWDLDNDGQFDDSTAANPVYQCGDGLQIIPITLRVSDEVSSDTDTSQITIINGAPMITTLEVDEPVFEGSAMTLTVEFTDYGPDTHNATIDWGDGTADTVLTSVNNDQPFNTLHTYADGDDEFTTYTVTVTITDDDQASTVDTLDVDVFNVEPTADVGGPYNAELGLVFDDFDFSATDPAGVNDDLTYYWIFDYSGNWDCDGDFDVDADDFVCADDYEGTSPDWTYGTLGEYTVALMVCDEDYTTFGWDTGCSEIVTADLTVWDWVMDLHTGWNLISIPLVPLDADGNIDTSLENVLLDPLNGALADDVTYPILSYQFDSETAANVWLQSTETGTGNDSTLTEVVPGYAYWIKMDEEMVLAGNGQELGSWGMPPEVSLQTLTWNLIGKYGNTEVDKGDQTEDLGYNDPDMRNLADYSVVEVDDNDLSQGDYLGMFDPMEPKEGYWTFTGGNSFFTDQPVRYIPSEADYAPMGGP